jgi:DNA replication initiation complex subunit (GINS family)
MFLFTVINLINKTSFTLKMDATITYEFLYDSLRKEKDKTELQKLEDSFYEKTIRYMEEKKEILKSQEEKESIFTEPEVQKTRKQIENIQKIIKELYDTREKKIIQLSLITSKTNNHSNNKENMLNEEKKFYEDITYTLNNYRENLLNNLVRGKKIAIENLEKNKKIDKPKHLKDQIMPTKLTKSVKFINEVPSFVGTDLNIYGPFQKEDTASIPLDVANLLIKSNKVIENENS